MMDSRDIVDNTADVRVKLLRSHASDDVEDANFQSVANDCVTDYENDDLSNKDENIIASNSLPDNQLTEVSSGLLTVSNRDDVLVDGSNGQSVPVVQNLVYSSCTRTTKLTLVDNLTRQGPVDGNHEHLSIHLPSHGCISPSEDFDDDRDPNYATQRPDTLGAINVPAAASAFSGPVAKPVYQVAAPLRAWPTESAAEDSLLTDDGTAHLGRRTCGAGMDQLELNQRQLKNDVNAGSDDDEGSGLCDDDDGDDDNDDDDTGLGSANQCESTEADQYKMDPEADQSAGAVDILSSHFSTELQENSSVLVIADDVRFGVCGCTLGQRHQTDGAVSDVSHDMDDPEEDQVERATVSVENATLEPAASLYVQKHLDAAHAVPVVSDEHKHQALKQHPQSAFSIPKPRLTKNKPGQSDSASCSNRPVPSVRHSKSNTDIVFKPINTSVGKSNSVPRTLITSKGLSATGTIHGELMHHTADRGHLSALNTGISHEEKDADGDIESNRHPSKSAEASGRSTWSREPLCNTMDQAVAEWNAATHAHTSSCASLPSACHFPSEGGYVTAGTFAPAISSSQQATPQKTDAHACRVLENSLDMSPIQPGSSSSSRPLSANGLHMGDLASVSSIFPGTELYFGTQGLPPQYSHKVRISYLFMYLIPAGYAEQSRYCS